jgi:hypothetical protein
MGEKLVKLKILKNVGHWMQGDEVEVPESQAIAMCTIRKKHNGYELVDHRTAMTMEELEKIKAAPFDHSQLTVEELKDLGLKNVTPLPKADLERPFHPGFTETKDEAEGQSARQSIEMNEKNLSSKKKVS